MKRTPLKRARGRALPWLMVASVALLGLGACGEEEKVDQECFSNKKYFNQKVFKPVLEQRCFSCHNSSGVAQYTKFVLEPSSKTGYVDANMAVFAEMAKYEREGELLLLAKPQGKFDHGGAKVLAAGSPELEAIQSMLGRLKNPVVCDDEKTVAEEFSPVELLTPEETARRATLNLGGRLPTAEEQQLIEEQGLDALDTIVANLAKEDTFYVRLEEMFNDLFLTNRYLGGTSAVDLLNRDRFPNARWYREDDAATRMGVSEAYVELANNHTNNAVASAPLKLISHIVREDRPFTEILTADYMMVTPFSARVYDIGDVQFDDPNDPNEWKMARIADQPHAGVLSSPMFLNRFPTTATNRNRHRSRMVYKFFLATDVMALAERPLDPTSIQDFNPTLYNPQCTSCHGVIDPLAGAFQNWDTQGMYNQPENGWFEDMRQPGFESSVIDFENRGQSLPWLADKMAKDPRFAVATVRNLYTAVTGLEPINPITEDPELYAHLAKAQEVQEKFFDELAAQFIADNYNLKTVIKGLVKSPYFRARNLPETADEGTRAEYTDSGRGRLLTPEMLHRKVEAVTGQPWRDNTTNLLLSTRYFRILYGGIDSNGVVERITEPNGIMANIQWRMATEMACATTAKDFVRGEGTRLYFPHVERTFQPEDVNGFIVQESVNAIKRNIQHLHWHFLGERLDIKDPEIERTYNLFYDTWKEGKAKVAAKEVSDRLNSRCDVDRDPLTDEPLPDEQRLYYDRDYTIRAWSAVITYLLADYRFTHE